MPWPHVDQSPTRRGLSCAQGIINLSQAGPEDGGLLLLQGSSQLFDQFFEEHPPKPKAQDAPGQFDWFGFTLGDVAWFKAHGCKLIKVCAEPGDLIIWDSRTVHYAELPKSDTIRTIIYATYTPAALATPEDLKLKAKAFHEYEGTTHWPHCNIFTQGKAMRNGKVCPGERDEPLEKPVHSDKLLKLAGVIPY
jgi:ectoine hydroxylase-related dioxygenase (phytanoyl-CoA dioxygenase family)